MAHAARLALLYFLRGLLCAVYLPVKLCCTFFDLLCRLDEWSLRALQKYRASRPAALRTRAKVIPFRPRHTA
jgi:hypothetical protein